MFMKKQNKKRGFTITELVIVISVIAILSAVMIPTFSGLINKSKKSARAQKATTAYHAALGVAEMGSYDNGTDAVDAYVVITDEDKTYYFAVEGGQIAKETETKPTDFGTLYEAVDFGETITGVTFYKTK